MNNIELKQKVYSAVYNTLKEKIYLSPVEMLIKMGVLSEKDYENWRFGHVPYLEKVCKTNLSKLSMMMKVLRAYARDNHLKPSRTVYNQWGIKGKKAPLRFSKSGDSGIEEAYATHFVVNTKRDNKADYSKEEPEDKRSDRNHEERQ